MSVTQHQIINAQNNRAFDTWDVCLNHLLHPTKFRREINFVLFRLSQHALNFKRNKLF